MASRSSVILANRYKLGPQVGASDTTDAWSALDMRLEREVTVKALHPWLAADPVVRWRFQTEARAAARLNHPNIVAVFDAGQQDGVPFVVIERLPGRTLDEVMAAGPPGTDLVRQIGTDVLAGLAAAHKAGIVHGHLEPSCIRATPGGRWKVGDFGSGSPGSTMPSLSPSTDLFSIGAVLFAALVGRPPGPYPPPCSIRQLRPDVDPGLASVIDRSMSVDPAMRFATAAEMAALLSGRESSAPPPAMASPPRSDGARKDLTTLLSTRWRQPRRMRATAVRVAAGFIVAAMTFGVGAVLMSNPAGAPASITGRGPGTTPSAAVTNPAVTTPTLTSVPTAVPSQPTFGGRQAQWPAHRHRYRH